METAFVREQPDSAIRAYTYERALMMEQRAAMMKELRSKKKKHKKLIVVIKICPASAFYWSYF
jgi:hypothetical protein